MQRQGPAWAWPSPLGYAWVLSRCAALLGGGTGCDRGSGVGHDRQVRTNWAGSYTYRAREIRRPATVAEVQTVVARADRVRPLGSGHSFTSLPDSEGELVRLDGLPASIEIDS